MGRFLIAQGCLQRIGLTVWCQTEMLFNELTDFLNQSVKTRALFTSDGRASHQRGELAISILNANSGRSLAALDDHFDLAVLLFLRLQDAAERTNPINLVWRGFVDGGIVLCSEENSPVGRQGLFQGPH
jgi:hypothetical protein